MIFFSLLHINNIRKGQKKKKQMSTSTKEGKCACGKITIQVKGAPLQTALCLCKDCRFATSSIGQVVQPYKKSQVSINDPENLLKTYTMNNTESGKPKHMTFCGNCGSGLVGYPTKFGVAVIRPAILGEEEVKPTKIQWGHQEDKKLTEKVKSLL